MSPDTQHACTDECREDIGIAVANKLHRYETSDNLYPSRGKTLSYDEAMAMLLANPTCKNCKITLKLHDWEPFDPSQFSFDRIDDYVNHTYENVQIYCYGCNVAKATKYFKAGEIPKNNEDFNQYQELKKTFYEVRNRMIADRKTLSELSIKLHSLHDDIFINRKNPWY